MLADNDKPMSYESELNMAQHVMEIVTVGVYQQQEIVNRWNYIAASDAGAVSNSLLLAQGFGATIDQVPPVNTNIIGKWLETVSSLFTLTEVNVRDVYSPTDFYAAPMIPPAPGALAGEAQAPFVAFGFRTNRVRADIRRGQKRFVGVRESDMESGGGVVAGVLTNLNALGVMMTNDIVVVEGATTHTFSPCVVGREKYTVPGTTPPRYAYRYYEDEAEQLTFIALGMQWTPYTTVRSQVSRQYGHGS